MPSLGSCTAIYRNPYRNSKMRLTYIGGFLQLEIDALLTGAYVSCFGPVKADIPTGYRFGLTAKTGPLFDFHDVYSFAVFTRDDSNNNNNNNNNNNSNNNNNNNNNCSKGGWPGSSDFCSQCHHQSCASGSYPSSGAKGPVFNTYGSTNANNNNCSGVGGVSGQSFSVPPIQVTAKVLFGSVSAISALNAERKKKA
ncbi:putative uncharacterized protein DDB_G0293878 [Tigriopus californicus]|uniref:putative uncharacterized protein DDB_G0293878 n=1 Tax=Tigriopus californicus TaxID=6832 RepID=UPI0027DA03FA|nr:putative uncharacterized protein DDB_G0293878 [Tigriopus californicus]